MVWSAQSCPHIARLRVARDVPDLGRRRGSRVDDGAERADRVRVRGQVSVSATTACVCVCARLNDAPRSDPPPPVGAVVDEHPAPATSSTAKPRQPCVFFLKGTCRNGDSCPFLHDESAVAHGSAEPGSSKTVCRFFASGTCTKGDQCKFSHDLSAVGDGKRDPGEHSAGFAKARDPSPPVAEGRGSPVISSRAPPARSSSAAPSSFSIPYVVGSPMIDDAAVWGVSRAPILISS